MLVKLAFVMEKFINILKNFRHDQQRWGDTAVMRGDIELMGVPQSLPLGKTLHQVPGNKKPPCIRNISQFSYETMDKTIDYCSKIIGCTRKSGFLFVGTHCN